MRFKRVEDLVAHVSHAHPESAPNRSLHEANSQQRGSAGIESCPYCGQSFSDPVMLIRHVHAHEHEQHMVSSGSKSECVIS